MNDNEKTREQLEQELTELRSQNAALNKLITGNISADLTVEETRLYAESIAETVREPVLVLDGDLKIISANRNFYRTFKVTPDETLGSFIYDLGNKQWDIPRLREMLEEILPKKETLEDFEVIHFFRDIGRKIMLLNAHRIYRKDIGAQMILLAIEDITGRKQLETEIQDAKEYAENIVETVREPLVVLDSDLKILTANHSFYDTFKVTPAETIGNFIYDLGNRQWDIPKLRVLFEEILPHDTMFNGYEVEHDFPDIGRKNIMLNARQIFRENIGSHIILLAMEDITERKQLESLLLESEERYRRIFETSKDGIVLLEKSEGHITHANPAAEKMFGYSSKECFGKRLQDIGVMLDMGDFQTTMQDLNKNGIINYTDVLLKNKSGLFIETDIYLVDRARLAQCNIRDVTERNRAEVSLRVSEDKYRRLHDSMRDAFVSVDMDGHITDWNESYLNMIGYSSEEIKTINNKKITPEKWHAFEQTIVEQQIIPNGFSEIYEKEYQKKDGTIFPVELRMFLLRDNADNPSYMWAIVRDITERKRTEEALSASEEKYRLLVESANEAIFVVQDAMIKFCNPKSLDIVGFSREEILSTSFIQFIHPEDRDTALERYQRRMSGEVLPAVNTFRLIDKGGNIRWVDVNAMLISWEGRPASLNFLSDITERKDSEMALRNQKDFFETFIDTIPTPVFNKDRNGVYLGCNEQYASTIIGLPKEEIIGRTIMDLTEVIPRDLAQRYHDNDMDLIRMPGLRFYEEDMACAGGTTRTFVFSKATFTDLKGEVSGMVGIMMDISQRKLIEQDLRDAEHNLAIRSRISDIYLNFSGNELYAELLNAILDISRSTYGLFGYLDEAKNIIVPALTSEVWKDCLLPEKTVIFSWEKICNSIFGQTVTGRTSILTNLKGNVPEGHVPIDNILTVPLVYQNAVIGIFAVANKVSGYGEQDERILKNIAEYIAPIMQSRMQQEKEEQRRMKADELILRQGKVLDQSMDGIAITDLEGTIQYVNPAWASMHGYVPDELMGVNIDTFHTPCQAETEESYHLALLKQGISQTRDIRHKRKDGTMFPTLLTAFTLKEAQGTPTNIVTFARDITEELRIDNLLRQAQKMEAVGQLAGGIAHDFNNMLSPILGYSDLLLSEMKPEDPHHHDILQIKQAGERAKDLTWQLLAFSRKQVMEMKKTDLRDVIADWQKILRRTIREDIPIRVILSPTPNLIYADVGKIGQILMNLAINAQDAMPQGGTITIETTEAVLDEAYTEAHPGTIPGIYAMLAFSDTGIGMDQRTLEHIFEPFFTTKDPGKGTGLGLATIYGIVKQHNGYIMAYSEPGVGTTFKVYLPNVKVAVEGIEPEAEEVNEIKCGTETVMVVEDEDAVRELVCRILRKHGYTVISAVSAHECLQAIEHHQGTVDLLLTDVIMPDMNGKQLFESIAAAIPAMKVIFLSGYTNDVIVEHGMLMKGINFISKPFTVRELTEKVRAVLDN